MDIDIDDNGDGTFSVYYTVKDAGEYTLSIKFGGNPVPDGVYNFTVSPTFWNDSFLYFNCHWERDERKRTNQNKRYFVSVVEMFSWN